MYVPVMCAASSVARNSAVPGDLGRAGDAAHRRQRAQLVAAAGLPVLAAERRLGLDEPGREDVDPDRRRERVRVGLGGAEEAVLGRGVLRRTRAAADDDRRADVDDRAVALVEHPLPELVDARHGALDVDGEDVVDRLLGDVPPRHLLARDVADVVDQHVDLAERLERGVGHRRDLRPLDDVGLQQHGLGALGAHAFGGRLRTGGRAAVVDADGAGALLRGADGDLGAEAGAGAGDDDGATLEAPRDGEGSERHGGVSFAFGTDRSDGGQTSVRPPSM